MGHWKVSELVLILVLVLYELNGKFLLVLLLDVQLEDIRNEHCASSNSGTKVCVRHTEKGISKIELKK